MEIECEKGAAWRCAEGEPRNATHNSLGRETGCWEKGARRGCVKKLGKESCSAARHTGTERAETREGLGLEKIASCCNSDRWWGAKLNFGPGSRSTTTIGPPHLGHSQVSFGSLVQPLARFAFLVPGPAIESKGAGGWHACG